MKRWRPANGTTRVLTHSIALLLTYVVTWVLAQPAYGGDAERHFESKIRPVLVRTCQKCHGNEERGGLRLDSREEMLSGGARGGATLPGKPKQSLLYQAIAGTHASLQMPPSGPLAPHVIEDFARWIAEGAVWPESRREFYQRRVEPILRDRCYSCHNDTSRKGGLRLELRHLALAGGKSGPAIQPRHPDQSLLIQVIKRRGALKMPPTKTLSDDEVAVLVKWVAEGAVYGPPLDKNKDYQISETQRQFWSFQPLQVPRLAATSGEHPVDQLIDARLAEQGLEAGPPAEPAQLARRSSYDLTGLPPDAENVDRFVAAYRRDPDSTWVQWLETLLASRAYGERWGRHWLDLVRYADTAGDAADFPVPEAYKYRNYVIDAFQHDLPYDQFIREQIAGDLLAAENDNQRWKQVIATGYLAISRRIGVSPHNLRHITIEDTINNLGRTFLGLTVGCARCHDHKFDPIPTADYYALYGIFESSVYPHPGAEHKPWREQFVYRVGKEQADTRLAKHREVLNQWNQKERAALERYRDFQRKKVEDPNRSREQAWQHVLAVREARRPYAEAFPVLERAYAVVDGPDPHDAVIQKGGNPAKRGRGPLVRRGFLQILGGATLPADVRQSGRRQLAEWIADSGNPLTSRVMVNRIWHYHFGKGLVRSTSDFGVRGDLPTHPRLLDWLAQYLIDQKWSVKQMHRLLMTSKTYRRSSVNVPANRLIDPRNRYLWRFDRQRLDAEQFRDSVLAVSGNLDTEPGGRHPFDHHLTYFYRQHEPFVGDFPTTKRSIYMMQQRINKNPYLDLFDGPDGNIQLAERKATTTTLQALFLMNSEFIHEQAAAIAARVMAAAAGRQDRIRWLYRSVLGRRPTAGEVQRGEKYLRWSQIRSGVASSPSGMGLETAWRGYARGMLASNEFLYID
ncbi:MAG: PSD1 and planctomycete cytochrome C domain-containing protein [Planctomycetota bacterium]|nr:PSD1 and planctomycete cytochrome C domain-containing protein [Planctomycetota bacterium]